MAEGYFSRGGMCPSARACERHVTLLRMAPA
jgi:hypothetical protein